jgi:uncharacterized repeat protein (TIGR03803 family)
MYSRNRFAILMLAIAVSLPVTAQQPVHAFACNSQQFDRSCPGGGAPGAIFLGSDGNLYGVAAITDSTSSESKGGLVYSLTPGGNFHILYQFVAGTKENYPDGSSPTTLAEGPDGMLYGATSFGGKSNAGTLFRLNKDGSGFEVIRSLCESCEAHQIETGPWILAGDGNFYGVAPGKDDCFHRVPCGAIYRITPATGVDKFVVQFKSPTEYIPNLSVVAPDGTLYGTLESDGASPMLFHFDEVVGKLTTSVLDVPTGGPYAGAYSLVIGPNGNFFGLYDYYDGQYLYATGLFEVQMNGAGLKVFPVIPNFAFSEGMAFGSDGNIWIAQQGLTYTYPEYGAIVTVSPKDGSLIETLQPFSPSSAVGAFPISFISGSDGSLWGVTAQDGQAPQNQFGAGVVFNLMP